MMSQQAYELQVRLLLVGKQVQCIHGSRMGIRRKRSQVMKRNHLRRMQETGQSREVCSYIGSWELDMYVFFYLRLSVSNSPKIQVHVHTEVPFLGGSVIKRTSKVPEKRLPVGG